MNGSEAEDDTLKALMRDATEEQRAKIEAEAQAKLDHAAEALERYQRLQQIHYGHLLTIQLIRRELLSEQQEAVNQLAQQIDGIAESLEPAVQSMQEHLDKRQAVRDSKLAEERAEARKKLRAITDEAARRTGAVPVGVGRSEEVVRADQPPDGSADPESEDDAGPDDGEDDGA